MTDTAIPRKAPVTTGRQRLETALRAAGERYVAADRAADQIRDELVPAVLDAVVAGFNEEQLAALTGATRQSIRNWQGKVPYATAAQLRRAAKELRARPVPDKTREQIERELRALGERRAAARDELRQATVERKAAGMAALSAGFKAGEVQQIGQVSNKALHGWTGAYDYAAHRRDDRATKRTQRERRRRK